MTQVVYRVYSVYRVYRVYTVYTDIYNTHLRVGVFEVFDLLEEIKVYSTGAGAGGRVVKRSVDKKI